MKQPNLTLPLSSELSQVLGTIECGRISDLSASDATLLGKHFGAHPESLYLMSSGVPVQQLSHYGLRPSYEADRVIGIEWGRHETSPKTFGGELEKEINSYRYLGAVSHSEKRIDIWVVTETGERSPGSLQVGDHHMTLPEVCVAYFGES